MQTKNNKSSLLLVESLTDCKISRESGYETSSIIDCIGDLLFVIDKKRVITKVNKSTCDMFKKKPEEIVGKHCYEIVHGTEEPWCNCPATETFETKQIVTEEIDDPHLGIPVLVTTSPILNEKGEVDQIIHIAKDISKMKLAEMDLHIAANLFDVASDSILVHEMDGRIIYFNEAACRTRGYTKDEFQTLKIQDLEGPEYSRFFGVQMNQLLEKGEATFEAVNLRKDKKILPVEINARIIESDGRKLVLSIARDISQRKVIEENLKQAEEKYRTLLNAANVLVQSVNSEGKYVFVNEEWKNVLGYNDQDLQNIKIMNIVRQDQQQHCMSVFGEVMNGKSIHDVETIFVAKDGKEIIVSGNACPIFKDGKFISTVAFFVDITERKKNEDKLKESTRRIELMVEKLRVVGGLTRHDVRNKLSTITGYAYLLKKKHPDQADIIEGLGKMEQAVKETVRIFDFAKMYEQLGAEELVYINVESKMNEACTLMSGALPKIVIDCQGLNLLADSFLRQLFYNFIDNTRKYGKKTTTIRLHCEKTEEDGLMLIYEDDGVGVSVENKTLLFKEGFSTGGSTGFGLFLTKKMMDVYGWEIVENGEPGLGARFIISIPKINEHGRENYQIVK
jgi:PAS domain S-box-containing protein